MRRLWCLGHARIYRDMARTVVCAVLGHRRDLAPGDPVIPRWVRVIRAIVTLLALAYLTHLLTSGPERIVSRPPVANTASTVLAEHAETCWQGEAPDDVEIPGHVVWRYPDGETVYSARLVGPALETTFGSGNLPGSPVAFCY